MKKYTSLTFLIIFEAIAIGLSYLTNNIFYFYNFSYIGILLTLGIYLYSKNYKYARNFIQIAIGSYMLIYLGILSAENMMITGFWYYLFLGVFEAAVIHYAVAKIFGPFLFGRGWCGYACWTAMILDLLPYEVPETDRKNYEYIRYIVFIVSLTLVISLFILEISDLNTIMFYIFIGGNILYYVIGILLAFLLKDNRAFCKYICPVTVFLKIGTYFSLLRVKYNKEKCINCNKCKNICPMNVDMCNNSRKRKNSTECILCLNCIKECPNNALNL